MACSAELRDYNSLWNLMSTLLIPPSQSFYPVSSYFLLPIRKPPMKFPLPWDGNPPCMAPPTPVYNHDENWYVLCMANCLFVLSAHIH